VLESGCNNRHVDGGYKVTGMLFIAKAVLRYVVWVMKEGPPIYRVAPHNFNKAVKDSTLHVSSLQTIQLL
jgi:hypothetical protein